MRWADARAELAVRSQIGFQGPSRRQAVYQVGIPSRKGSLWSVPIHIEALEVAGSRYQGELLLELGPEGRRVYGSSLVLERSDGVRFSIGAFRWEGSLKTLPGSGIPPRRLPPEPSLGSDPGWVGA